MFWQVVKQEWRLVRTDKTNQLLAALLVLFTGCALFTGVHWVHFQRDNLVEAQQEARATNQRLRQKLQESILTGKKYDSHADPGSAATVGARLRSAYAGRPPGLLAAVAVGQSDIEPYYYRVTAFERQSLIHGQEIENPAILFQGHFDLAFVIIYLWPLFIIAFAYHLISREKENGTLPLLRAQPVPIWRVFWYKFIFRTGLGLLGSLLLLAVFLAWAGVALTAPDTGWFLLAVAAYVFFWFSAAFLVASFNRSSAFNALGLLGVWLGLVILLPGMLNSAADGLYPVPSRLALINAQRQAVLHAAENNTNLVSKVYDEHPEFYTGQQAGRQPDREVSRYALQIETEKIAVPFEARFTKQVHQQQQFIRRFQYFSPAIMLQQQLNGLAGNGPARKAHFEKQTDLFQRRVQAYFRTKVFKGERLTPADYGHMPQFTYRELPVNRLSGRQFLLTGLVAGLLLLAARYQVRKIGD